jgi:hypothetical protein
MRRGLAMDGAARQQHGNRNGLGRALAHVIFLPALDVGETATRREYAAFRSPGLSPS